MSTPRLEEDKVPTPEISESNRTEKEGEEEKERFDFQPNDSTSTLIEETVTKIRLPMLSAILTHHRHTSACRCPFDKHYCPVRVTHALE